MKRALGLLLCVFACGEPQDTPPEPIVETPAVNALAFEEPAIVGVAPFSRLDTPMGAYVLTQEDTSGWLFVMTIVGPKTGALELVPTLVDVTQGGSVGAIWMDERYTTRSGTLTLERAEISDERIWFEGRLQATLESGPWGDTREFRATFTHCVLTDSGEPCTRKQGER